MKYEIIKLSNRESEIVALLQKGILNKEIAFELGITEGTVKQYIDLLHRKIGARNRTDIVVKAFKNEI